MADIQFNEPAYARPVATQSEQKSLFIRLVLATGIVSTDKAAERVLLGFAFFGLIFALFLFTRGGTPAPPPENEIIWIAGPDAAPGKM